MVCCGRHCNLGNLTALPLAAAVAAPEAAAAVGLGAVRFLAFVAGGPSAAGSVAVRFPRVDRRVDMFGVADVNTTEGRGTGGACTAEDTPRAGRWERRQKA